MTLEEELRFIMSEFCDIKTRLCDKENGPLDLVPMLHFKYRHLKGYCGILLEGNPFEMTPITWRRMLDDGIPEFMMLMVEGYASTTPSEKHEKGALEREFKENPCSEVVEVIAIQAIEIKTGNQMTAVVEYKYGDDGMPVFGEPKVGPCEGAELETNVPAMFKMCRDLTVKFMEAA